MSSDQDPNLLANDDLNTVESLPMGGEEIDHAPVDTPAGVRALPDLALFGAQPAFDEMVHVGRPNMPNKRDFMERMDRMLDSGRLTNNGPMVGEFEDRVARISGVRDCVATCNGTVALELAIRALDMVGEVIVPSFTFVATVHSLWRQGIRPVFCDIDPVSHVLDVESVRSAITDRTTGILAVSLWGNDGRMEDLKCLADERGLRLLVDSAHSFGCGEMRPVAQGLCDAEVFSFHATKCVHAIEGGAIITDDDRLASKLRLMVNFGFAGEDLVQHTGTNGKMTEASAAMGLTSLEAMEEIFAHNRRNYFAYGRELAKIPGIRLMHRDRNEVQNFHYIVTEVDPDVVGIRRDDIVSALRLENIAARRYFHPGCHRMKPYSGLFPRAGLSLPNTERLSDRIMVLPNGLSMDDESIRRVTRRIAEIVAAPAQVRAGLERCTDPRHVRFEN
ncbi:MAG: aminotransferase class I/II-fold pyridoxal phosphate-dependent enzyme [Silicimonas sp.]|nr:aminotransferase class I/II-fold pyridoxal phosphate-dependent enzyme [Silicimonas sp.]